MRKYKIFHSIVLSFYSKSLYQDVAQNWKGAGIVYLLLLALIVSLPITVRVHQELSKVPEVIEPVIQQVPDISLKKGKISIDPDQPYLINDPSQENNPVIIIDTTGKHTSLEGTNAQVLITETKIFAKDRSYDLSNLSQVEKFVVTKEGIRTVISVFIRWFSLAAFPFILLFLFVFRILHVLLFSLISMLFTKILKVNLIFEQLMRLTALAITPVIIANLILSFIDVKIPFWFRLLITIGYLYFAVYANSPKNLSSKETQESS